MPSQPAYHHGHLLSTRPEVLRLYATPVTLPTCARYASPPCPAPTLKPKKVGNPACSARTRAPRSTTRTQVLAGKKGKERIHDQGPAPAQPETPGTHPRRRRRAKKKCETAVRAALPTNETVSPSRPFHLGSTRAQRGPGPLRAKPRRSGRWMLEVWIAGQTTSHQRPARTRADLPSSLRACLYPVLVFSSFCLHSIPASLFWLEQWRRSTGPRTSRPPAHYIISLSTACTDGGRPRAHTLPLPGAEGEQDWQLEFRAPVAKNDDDKKQPCQNFPSLFPSARSFGRCELSASLFLAHAKLFPPPPLAAHARVPHPYNASLKF